MKVRITKDNFKKHVCNINGLFWCPEDRLKGLFDGWPDGVEIIIEAEPLEDVKEEKTPYFGREKVSNPTKEIKEHIENEFNKPQPIENLPPIGPQNTLGWPEESIDMYIKLMELTDSHNTLLEVVDKLK